MQWKVRVMTSRDKQKLLSIDFSQGTEETLWELTEGRDVLWLISL